jgi:hypothetical protein
MYFRMDGFGDNFDQPEVDPAAEFLAREHDQLAGLEDELSAVTAPLPVDGILYVCYLYKVLHFTLADPAAEFIACEHEQLAGI